MIVPKWQQKLSYWMVRIGAWRLTAVAVLIMDIETN